MFLGMNFDSSDWEIYCDFYIPDHKNLLKLKAVNCYNIEKHNYFKNVCIFSWKYEKISVRLSQGFPIFFAAYTPLSGQRIIRTPIKIQINFFRYILLNSIT